MSSIEKVYHDEDVNMDALKGKVVAIMGYGSQGRGQSNCLRDNGVNVIIGAGNKDRYPDWENAEKDGFTVYPFDEAVKKADVVMILLQDPAQPAVYYESIHQNLRPNQTLCFAHGFAILYGTIVPPEFVDVVLFVPNGPGPVVRQKFLDGSGIYGAVAVDQDVTGHAKETALAIAKGVGSTRTGTVYISFQHETEGDNFEEQVLYGGTINLMRAVYETMAKNGYPKSFAYAKAIRSIRSVIDDIDRVGIEEYLSKRCSRTCEFAVRTSGPRVINYDEIEKIFRETEKGEFAKRWLLEFQCGMPTLNRLRRTHKNSNMEVVGKEWREKFSKEV
ncbi:MULTISPECIES: ketol-acid reductoisomerase [Clostridium]|uniref:Ketol-acid reductoisomerase n=2 Tax=Clostridium TaxID=1485 RepID=D8GTE6_CLOLD|nr:MULTISPECIES: ketol-acid reductoisomerase [Clostridium]ADK14595.1 ketol-acid reductoisomerase [Clostridium ljungdahlii DSM 13528]AGY77836.1 ketol-acid reductoisomerase [Clostridium autoethanogenum DSM 10061]ALU37970.1 Ketol-acid reductoisomerase [Clostridium autoethanogenum DSM 10061]OAA85832.1 Ketol-acid reductoisomerase [Clostridium ljungdahlii DSM 13528]OVY50734.1 Ketol-acid reductoisomerase [Clostridium autoethanogenum]